MALKKKKDEMGGTQYVLQVLGTASSIQIDWTLLIVNRHKLGTII